MEHAKELVAVVFVVVSFFGYLFDRTRRMTPTHRSVLGVTIVSLILFVSSFLPTVLFGAPTLGELIEYFLVYFGLSLLLFHHLAYIFGGEITRWRRSKAWVKAIDYLYLLFGFIGILK